VLTVAIYNSTGEEVGTFEVDENVLGGKVRRRLMHEAVVMYEANKRQGTAKTKGRSEIAGSTKKPYRQKGTGNARAGSRKSPIWRGGGVVFGPQPRDYHYQMPRRARKEALKSAILSKIIDKEAILLDELQVERPETKRIAGILKNLKINGSCLLAIEDHNENIWKSARNIAGLDTKAAAELNAYDLLRRRRFVATKAAIENLIRSFEGDRKSGEQANG